MMAPEQMGATAKPTYGGASPSAGGPWPVQATHPPKETSHHQTSIAMHAMGGSMQQQQQCLISSAGILDAPNKSTVLSTRHFPLPIIAPERSSGSDSMDRPGSNAA
jgi:hypothetical protein